MNHRYVGSEALALAVCLVGCGHAPPPPSATGAAFKTESECPFREIVRSMHPNGPSFNGTQLGADTDGPIELASVNLLDGVRFGDGRTSTTVKVEGTKLTDQALADGDFVGALLAGIDTRGAPHRLRIDAVEAAPNPSLQIPQPADISAYSVSYEVPGSTAPTWRSLCCEHRADGTCALYLNGDPKPAPVIALAGLWDTQSGTRGNGGRLLPSLGTDVTFACLDSAIAKCVFLGYRPWVPRELPPGAPRCQATSSDFHEACVRAVRADYCGTGVSHTHPSVNIDIYDATGIQKDVGVWILEAQWGKGGAVCVDPSRLPEKERAGIGHWSCAASAPRDDTLIWTKLP